MLPFVHFYQLLQQSIFIQLYSKKSQSLLSRDGGSEAVGRERLSQLPAQKDYQGGFVQQDIRTYVEPTKERG